jgi:hypothetical protein
VSSTLHQKLLLYYFGYAAKIVLNKTEKSFSNLAASQFFFSRSNKSTTPRRGVICFYSNKQLGNPKFFLIFFAAIEQKGTKSIKKQLQRL